MRSMFDYYQKLWNADCEAKKLREELASITVAYKTFRERRGQTLLDRSAMSEEQFDQRFLEKTNQDIAQQIAIRSHNDCTEGTVTWEWVSGIGQ